MKEKTKPKNKAKEKEKERAGKASEKEEKKKKHKAGPKDEKKHKEKKAAKGVKKESAKEKKPDKKKSGYSGAGSWENRRKTAEAVRKTEERTFPGQGNVASIQRDSAGSREIQTGDGMPLAENQKAVSESTGSLDEKRKAVSGSAGSLDEKQKAVSGSAGSPARKQKNASGGRKNSVPAADDAVSRQIQLYRALGNASRLQILRLLQEREMRGYELLSEVPVVRSTLSHHLKTLQNVGLVSARKEGRWTYYSADKKMQERLACPVAGEAKGSSDGKED